MENIMKYPLMNILPKEFCVCSEFYYYYHFLDIVRKQHFCGKNEEQGNLCLLNPEILDHTVHNIRARALR